MPLYRVICVTHYTGFPFDSASFTELLCWCLVWHCLLGIAPVYLQELDHVSPCIDPGWPSCASFLFRSKTLSSPCKNLRAGKNLRFFKKVFRFFRFFRYVR